MASGEEIDQGDVLTGRQFDLQIGHEPARGEPEIVPHHDDRLEMFSIALSQGSDQFSALLTPLGMQPLLELVQDDQHLLPGT